MDEAFSADELRDADLTPLWLEAGWTLYLSSHIDQAVDVLQAGIDFNRNGTMRVVAPAAADNSQLVPTTAWVRGLVGTRTVSAAAPGAGGADGDVWYQV